MEISRRERFDASHLVRLDAAGANRWLDTGDAKAGEFSSCHDDIFFHVRLGASCHNNIFFPVRLGRSRGGCPTLP